MSGASFAAAMPPEAPLVQPVQDLRRPFRDRAAPPGRRTARRATLWRAATFVPAIAATTALIGGFVSRFARDGLSPIEAALIALIGFAIFWIALAMSTVLTGILAGIVGRHARPPAPGAAAPRSLDLALVVPVFGEDPALVAGNAAAMLGQIARSGSGHRVALYVLSDTREAASVHVERRLYAALARTASLPVHYRHRARNTDRKVGNIADWLSRWGGRHEAMVVLDADSLMSGAAVLGLADALAGDPGAGLIQSIPRLYGAQTLFARLQQFASTVYGAPLAAGLAAWSDAEGNYWGHNAILRLGAFAASAGLPRIGRRGRLILSHDFVEAGLMRRAGWAVRFVPQIGDSYEEVPPTLVDYVLRDRRWCQGNLQHLRVIGASGLHAVSRFHLFQGAMAYLASPAWFALLVAWAVLSEGQQGSVLNYFEGLNPQVVWPEMARGQNLALLATLYGMLLAPKVMAALVLGQSGLRLRDLGGARRFAANMALEVAAAIAFAPVLMVQQVLAVLRTAVGVRAGWQPQRRRAGRRGWGVLVRFHAVETTIGALLSAGLVAGVVTPWLAPIAASLVLAVPLSRVSGLNLATRRGTRRLLATAETFAPPRIIRAARVERRRLAEQIRVEDALAAE